MNEVTVANVHEHIERLTLNYNFLNVWFKTKSKGKSIAQYLLSKKIFRVAVYGLGKLAEHLLDEIIANEIVVEFIIDNRLEYQGGRYAGIPVTSTSFAASYPDVDLLIITAIYAVPEIQAELAQKGVALQTLSLDALVQELI